MEPSTGVTLNRLITRLDQVLLSQSPDRRLRESPYERKRTAANIEHARSLLLTLEKQSATIAVQASRQRVQADLQQKREVIKRLNSKLRELELEDDAEDEEDSDDEEGDISDDEDGIHRADSVSYAPARKDVHDGLDTGESEGLPRGESQLQELRSRRPIQGVSSSDNRTAASTTAREQLFAGRPPAPTNPSLSQSETLLSHNRTEQETLTSSLVGLAKALKDSSLQFSSSLEAEKEVLKRAEGGLDKSAQGMEAAEKRMGMLRRMSEGQGWWGRLKLYAFIFGLWVACFLVVFVGPKIRL